MASTSTINFRGRTYTLQRVRLADKSGHLWLWSEAGSGAHSTAASRDEALLAIGAEVGEYTILQLPHVAAVGEAPTFASPFDQEGAK